MRSLRRNITRIALLAVIGLCVALAGCARAPAPSVGGSTSNKAEKGRQDAESLAMHAVQGGATAQAQFLPDEEKIKSTKGPRTSMRAMPTPKTSPRPGSTPLIRERVVSTLPYPTEAEADADALAQACDLVTRKLSELDPPVHYKPSIGEVKADFIRKDSRTVRGPDPEEKKIFADYGVSGNVVYVEYDVEVSAEQVRELRSQDRVSLGLRILGSLFAVALSGFLFLRADEWTKGYLTRWLALGAVTVAGGTAAALIFI